MFTSKRRLKLATAAALLSAVAVGGTATAASAAVITNKPYAHTITVETDHVHVFQNNWLRPDVTRKQGYSVHTYSHSNPSMGGFVQFDTPMAENTLGRIFINDNATTTDGGVINGQSTSVYDGSTFAAARVEMSVDRGNTFPAKDSDTKTFNLSARSSTGWRHLVAKGAGGDFVELDFRITNSATPQS